MLKILKQLIFSIVISGVSLYASQSDDVLRVHIEEKRAVIQLPSNYTSVYTHAHFVDTHSLIMHHPKELLRQSQESAIPLIEHPSNQLSFAFFQQVTARNPLCFLSECMVEECMLSRSRSSLRKEFEDEIVEHIRTYYPSQDQELVYVSFGCGYLFTDCVILTKLLAAGYTRITVHLIDSMWRDYCDIVKREGPLPDCLVKDKKKFLWVRAHTYRVRQLLEWLCLCNKNIKSIHLYDSAESYLTLLKDTPTLLCDVLIGIDYFEESQLQTLDDFDKLAFVAVKSQGIVFSLITGDTVVDIEGKSFLDRVSNKAVMIKKAHYSYAQACEEWEKNKESFILEDFFTVLSYKQDSDSKIDSISLVLHKHLGILLGVGLLGLGAWWLCAR